MNWVKRGRIFTPGPDMNWGRRGITTPTPVLLNDEVIRVYAGFRDDDGISRIGYLDLAADCPSRILAVAQAPVMDLGQPGMFDDNGMILGDVIRVEDAWRMYYVGFQLVQKAKFLAFSGVAESHDGGASFTRIRQAPVMDRADEGLFIRAIHSVRQIGNCWRIWYAASSTWQMIGGKPYPDYHIRYIDSPDGLHIGSIGQMCLDHQRAEYRIGRPRVVPGGLGYRMVFTLGTLDQEFGAGYAESPDGVHWQRMDAALDIQRSPKGWDSRSVSYPALFNVRDKTYLFYTGNDLGAAGFGYAELISN